MSSLDVRSIDANQLRKQPCPSTKQEFRVFLSESAFDRAVARGDADTTREIGGVLVGELLRDDAGPYLRIDATIDALHAEEKGAELTFTHATWEHIHKEMDGKHQDKRVVGWYHTHPGFGVFLSDRDQFIHKSFFNLPFQVAFVYDPKSHEHGMFTWHDNEVWRARRYWIGPREQVWDGVRAPGDRSGREPPEAESHRPAKAERDAERAPSLDDGPQGPLGMFIVVGAILLLIGGFAGHWFGTRSSTQVLEQVQHELDQAKLEGAQRAIGSLQGDLVGMLRDTLGDEATHRPVIQAVGILDQIIAALPGEGPAAGSSTPGSALPGQAGAGSAAPGAAAPTPGAPGAAAPTPGGPGSAARSTTPPTSPAMSGTGGDPRWAALAGQLKTARASLVQLEQSRGSAQAVLARLELMARRGNELPPEIAHDLKEQRAAVGGLYSELASQAAKAGDKVRARALLSNAAHFDPGNRTRYEKQLQSFDPSGRLSPENTDQTGSAGQGEPR